MGRDEEKAVDMLSRNRSIHQSCIEKFNGTLIKEIGDGMLASFSLASEAVRCAMEIQKECKVQGIPLKIGIHQGETVFHGADILGDGVNIASRIQETSKEGSIFVSGKVYSDIKNRPDIKSSYIGSRKLKNVEDPIRIYEVGQPEGGQSVSHDSGRRAKSLSGDPKRRKTMIVVLGFFILIIASISIWQFSNDDQTKKPSANQIADDEVKSIAVLPFKYMGGDEQKQYLSEGVMDVITSHLAKIGALQVKARTSVENYRDNLKNVKEIGQELEVNYIVEGSFQMQDNMVRLTIQLIDARNENHIYTDEYDRDWSDIFKVQSEVAQDIAREINAVINPEEKQRIETMPTGNLTAYDLYLQAEEDLKIYRRSEDKDEALLYKALALYREALEYDPSFAKAYLGLSSMLYFKKISNMSNDKMMDSARALIEKALSYDDQLEEAYLWLGSFELMKENMDENFSYRTEIIDKALSYCDQALEINPNFANAYGLKGRIYDVYSGDMVNAIICYHKALKLQKDAYWKPQGLQSLVDAYLNVGFFDKAIFYAGEKLKLDGDSIWYLYYPAYKEFFKINLRVAKALYTQRYARDSSKYYNIIDILAINIYLGLNKEALQNAQLLDSAVVHRGYSAYNYAHRIGYAFWINGEKEKAKAYFQKQIENCNESIRRHSLYAIEKYAYYDLAGVYAFLGDKEKAYENLDKYNTKNFENAQIVMYLGWDPMFNSIRDEERFQQIYRDIKAKYQREHDKLKAWMEKAGMI
jgi:TolB-like protein